MEKKRPVYEIRLGRVRAAIWQNNLENGAVRQTVSFSKLYKDGDQWKDSGSFGRQELLVLAKVADMAHTFLHEGQEEPTEE